MHGVWTVLIGNFAVVGLILSIWTHATYAFHRLSALQQRALLGVVIGSAAIASMMLSVRFQAGIYFDLRLALIQLAGAFGGPLPVAIAAILAAAYRSWMGGVGMLPGLAGIVTASTAGLAIWYLAKGRTTERPIWIVVAAVSNALVAIAVLTFLGEEAFRRVMGEIGVPIIVLHFLATGAGGAVLTYFRNFTLERDILFAALTQAPDFHYVKGLDHRFIVTNQNVAHHHGRSRPSQMRGLSDFDLTTADRAKELHAAERHIMQTGIGVEQFEEFLSELGDGRWFSTSKVPLRDRQGNLIGLAGVTVDITDRKMLEAQLVSSRQTMARAMADMSDGLAMFDTDGRLLFCNDQYREMFPLSAPARVQGAYIVDIVRESVRSGERSDLPSDAPEEVVLAAAATLATDKDETIPLSDGRWLSVRTRLLRTAVSLSWCPTSPP